MNLTFQWISEVGILLLIFGAGVETNINRQIQESKKAITPAIGGMTLPFVSGFILSYLYGYPFMTSLLVGTIFTATSISISLITLLEINKLNSIEGRCILNSAIIDDILGIIVISMIFSLSLVQEGSSSLLYKAMGMTMVKIIFFFIISLFSRKIHYLKSIANSNKLKLDSNILSLSVAVIFIYSWFADRLGLASIIGAFISGLVLGQTKFKEHIHSGMVNMGKSFFY
jgi:Kef-type K+ transport system membrane component KefB